MTQMGPGNWFITSCIINEFEKFDKNRNIACAKTSPISEKGDVCAQATEILHLLLCLLFLLLMLIF